MKLITEVIDHGIEYISEAKDGGGKNYYIEGVFMQGEIKNRNGRMYPIGILENEVQRYNDEYISKDRAYGELGHPDGPTINLERVSHMIKSLKREGTNIHGRAKILETPMGNIVKSLMNEGARLGVSSRGMGSLKRVEENGGLNVVQDDFQLATAADIVADPSAPSAFVDGIMEDVEWLNVKGTWVPTYLEKSREMIKKTPAKKLDEVSMKLFETFLRKL